MSTNCRMCNGSKNTNLSCLFSFDQRSSILNSASAYNCKVASSTTSVPLLYPFCHPNFNLFSLLPSFGTSTLNLLDARSSASSFPFFNTFLGEISCSGTPTPLIAVSTSAKGPFNDLFQHPLLANLTIATSFTTEDVAFSLDAVTRTARLSSGSVVRFAYFGIFVGGRHLRASHQSWFNTDGHYKGD